MRVEHFLRDSARTYRHKVALVAGERRLTFGDLDGASDRLAAVLSHRGVSRGDRVVVFMDNCWEAVVAIFAVMKAGAVLCPINPSTKAHKLAWLLSHCRASAMILQDRLAASARAALAQAHSVKLTIVVGELNPPGFPDGIRFDDAIAESAACPLEASGRHRPGSGDADLHLRLDRAAQGSDDHAPECRGVRDVGHLLPAQHVGRCHSECVADFVQLRALSGADGCQGRRHARTRKILRVPTFDFRKDGGGARYRYPYRAVDRINHPADEKPPGRSISASAVHHQCGSRAAVQPRRTLAGIVPGGKDLFHVRHDGVPPRHLAAA